MEAHNQLTDSEFEAQFASKTLDPKLFTHEAHLRLAWIHIKHYGTKTAIDNICRQIKAYAESLGARDKFNKTVTIAAIKAVEHFIGRCQGDSFDDIILEFPRLKENFGGLMRAHYGFEIFNNEKAKREFIPPDLVPFD